MKNDTDSGGEAVKKYAWTQWMKHYAVLFITLISLTLTLSPVYSQQTIEEITKDASELTDTDELLAIYNLDVFQYFNLSDDYDTPLKKERFKKTKEYKERLDELKKKRAELLKTTYYLVMNDAFATENYDINRKGFEISLNASYVQAPKTIVSYQDAKVLLRGLPTRTKRESNPFMNYTFIFEVMFLPMSEQKGLEIENDRENVSLYLFFRISGKERVTYIVRFPWGKEYIVTTDLLTANRVRVVVANKATGKIYYDKVYPK